MQFLSRERSGRDGQRGGAAVKERDLRSDV